MVRRGNDEGLLGEIVKPNAGNSSGSDKSIENEADVLFFAVVFDISCFPVKLFLFGSVSGTKGITLSAR